MISQFFKTNLMIIMVILLCIQPTLMNASIPELKSELLEIYKQFLSQFKNTAILELILNQIFNINYKTLINHDFTTKKNAFNSAFFNLGIKNYDEEWGWELSDFMAHANRADIKLSAIKDQSTSDIDNVGTTESTLSQLFGISYNELVYTNWQTKQLHLKMNFERLSWLPYNPFGIPDGEPAKYSASGTPRTGYLVKEEKNTLSEIEKDTHHFKDLKLVSGQRQKGVTCGSHAIINAWAIEQLLQADEEITASNIFRITQPYFTPSSHYPVNRFIHSEEICTQIPKFIAQDLEISNFKSRINFMAYNIMGLHYTEKPNSPSWFLNIGDINLMQDQIKAMLTLPPHVQHFIYNTGGHWVLASVIQKPGTDAVIYFIDSSQTPAITNYDTPRNRFLIALYKSFVRST